MRCPIEFPESAKGYKMNEMIQQLHGTKASVSNDVDSAGNSVLTSSMTIIAGFWLTQN